MSSAKTARAAPKKTAPKKLTDEERLGLVLSKPEEGEHWVCSDRTKLYPGCVADFASQGFKARGYIVFFLAF